ncbi:hypothetical protein JCM6882_001533 [Rhodosporidiobolus microsporus]
MGILSAFFFRIAPNSDLSHTAFPPPSAYDPARDMPDQRGKVCIVTGANTGVGYETAKQLVLKNAKVYVGSRSEKKGLAAVESLRQTVKEQGTTGEAVWLKLDLADLDSVKAAAEEFNSKERKLDLLFNNAGVLVPPTDELTKQGFDLQWGTNVVGHYLFSLLLLPSLRASYASTGIAPRIVHTSSSAHANAPGSTGFSPSTFSGGAERDETLKEWGGVLAPWSLYGQSKMGSVMVAKILQEELGEEGVSMSCNPGLIKTELHRTTPSWQLSVLSLFLYPPPMGALTQLWGATSPEGANFQGKYLWPWARMGKTDPRADNEETLRMVKEHLDNAIAPWLAAKA